jgi:hypothetical protein
MVKAYEDMYDNHLSYASDCDSIKLECILLLELPSLRIGIIKNLAKSGRNVQKCADKAKDWGK